MKNLLTLVAALFFVTVAVQAQVNLTGDPNATIIGQLITTTHVEIGEIGFKRGADIANEVVVWRTSGDAVVVSISTPSIAPIVAGEINEIPTNDIYKQISMTAVAEAVRLNHITATGTTKVWYESIVERSGSGMSTHFATCGGYTPVARDYSVTFDGGVATIVDNTLTQFPLPCSGGGAIE